MLAVSVNPASKARLVIASDAVAICSVNTPKDIEFAPVDLKTIAAARAAGTTNITSVETTHGVIRAQWPDASFIYVTAIPNRVGHFQDEAQSNYLQEFASTHNAGIVLNHIMPHFIGAIAQSRSSRSDCARSRASGRQAAEDKIRSPHDRQDGMVRRSLAAQ